MLKRKAKIENKHLLIIISAFLILGSIFLLVYKYYGLYENHKQEEKSIEIFFQEIPQIEQETTEEQVEEESKKESVINYIAVLEIPKISLKRGLVDKNSKYNDVDINIYTLKESVFPNEQANSHVILASHSGSGYHSYFRKLNNLEMEDKVYLYYENIKYIYEITDRYEVEKTGTVSLRQTTGSDITLITCISGTNKQVVFVGKLIEKENY